ncbi:ER to Golgi transport-related protein [Dioszegia hungarica]|uniref:Coatomer subunit beta n=1 Tax=Dioszegia hungarica TaxID=4972 RepID=A0AA38LXQ9_9TREE|nr:ER to Golgi transport-related protein [Dioszegia hungarica]KAI9638983.1 ER to Golgi transport-related protein [Dioszegia hungarica]
MDPSSTCYSIVHDDLIESPNASELRNALQKGSDEVKLETMRRIIVGTLNGQSYPQLLMPIIQYVMPSRNKQLKKMLHFYWEICPKLDDNGKLKHEMILVCDATRRDLQHPNEYIRGATLRYLQKIREPELLEPLIPTVRSCLEHRHSFVRKNAVFAVYSIYQDHEHLIPDAPELLDTFLAAESDMTCKRNAFVTLCNISQPTAVRYLLSNFDSIGGMDELMQMAVIELVRKEAKTEGGHRAKWIRCIFELLNSPSHAVKYEAATSLTTLTQNPAAVKAAAAAFAELIVKEADNNVKLIVLDRFNTLRSKHEHVLDGMVMDILKVLSSQDMEVKRKAIGIALEMVSSRNVEDVVLFLKKQLQGTMESEFDKNLEYRQLLIQSIHSCAIKFSEVAANVVYVLMEFLGDSNNPSAVDVIAFVREVVEKFPKLRTAITEKLVATFSEIKSGKVYRGALWIVGEYCEQVSDIKQAMQEIRKVLGEIPILASEQRLFDEAASSDEAATEKKDDAPKAVTKTRVLADGTYATETTYTSNADAARLEAVRSAAKPPLRSLILGGDFFTGSVLAATLTKLILRLSASETADSATVNELKAEALLIMTSIVRVGQSKFAAVAIDEDSQERIMNCIETLAELGGERVMREVFLEDTKAAYTKMIASAEKKAAAEKAKEAKDVEIQADDLISFRQLSKKAVADVDDLDLDVGRATGAAEVNDDFVSKLSRIVQLTGYSDAVYCECVTTINQFDVILNVLLVNQTTNTLQNLSVDFQTLGDLKLVERPAPHTLGPHGFHQIKATIKVSSTETGVIFGSITYSVKGSDADANIVLSDIHLDILSFIQPAYVNEATFRSSWTEFEWENKVALSAPSGDLRKFVDHLAKETNLQILTPENALSGDCSYLSCNMAAKSLFGEDALGNISLELDASGEIRGHLRIRSRTQGIALSLGDKITLSQKAFKP